jgi:dTDP-D-glucose 4,6-dehydratase
MSLISLILQMPPQELRKTVDKLKKMVKERDNLYRAKGKEIFSEHTKQLKKETGWSKDRTMKKVFSLPLEVYLSNQNYWDDIINQKQFNKHPEWQTAKPIAKFVK